MTRGLPLQSVPSRPRVVTGAGNRPQLTCGRCSDTVGPFSVTFRASVPHFLSEIRIRLIVFKSQFSGVWCTHRAPIAQCIASCSVMRSGLLSSMKRMVWAPTRKSLVHFEVIFLCGVSVCPSLPLPGRPVVAAPFVEKTTPSPSNGLGTLVGNPPTAGEGSSQVLCSVPLAPVCMSVLMPGPPGSACSALWKFRN